jgi:hypothetical protein
MKIPVIKGGHKDEVILTSFEFDENEIKKLRKEVEDKDYKLNKRQIRLYIEKYENILGELPLKYIKAFGGQMELQLPDGYPVLYSIGEIIIGAHGPYIEFEESEFILDLITPDDQQWRLNGNYTGLKYEHLAPEKYPDIKIYKQINRVKYADYKPGCCYIDLLEIGRFILI